MGQAVKYATLGVALATIIVSILALIGQVMGGGALNDFSNGVANFIGNSQVVNAIKNVRGCINYIIGAPAIVTVCLWAVFLLPLIKIPIYIAITVVRFINQ